FISLVGQFILSPAMAMPKFLHASSHVYQPHVSENNQPQASLIPTAVLIAESFRLPHIADSQISCDSTAPNLDLDGLGDFSLVEIDCDALCELLGADNCVSHYVSAPGIMEQEQFTTSAQSSTASVQTVFWSLQTAELSPINSPPISL
ncbi:hypothetical protein ACVBKF_11890, partial [Shewanella sp. 0m-11]